MPSVGSPAILPNTTVKITVVRSGCSRIHIGPRIVWRYMIVKFRFTISHTRSRYCQMLLKSIANQLRLGRITVVHCPLACFLAMRRLLKKTKIAIHSILYHVLYLFCKSENVKPCSDNNSFG